MKIRKTLIITFLVLLISLDIFIIVESCIGGTGSASQSQGITQLVIDIIHAFNPSAELDVGVVHNIVRKVCGHFLLFGLSGILTTLVFVLPSEAFKKHFTLMIISIIGKGVVLACVTEIIQIFTPGRSGNGIDILIDMAGYILFAFIIFIIFYIHYLNKNKKPAKAS